jgi:hypothetical protein
MNNNITIIITQIELSRPKKIDFLEFHFKSVVLMTRL